MAPRQTLRANRRSHSRRSTLRRMTAPYIAWVRHSSLYRPRTGPAFLARQLSTVRAYLTKFRTVHIDERDNHIDMVAQVAKSVSGESGYIQIKGLLRKLGTLFRACYMELYETTVVAKIAPVCSPQLQTFS